MIRIYKTVLATCAVGLLMAMGAGAAQAAPVFEAGKYPALVKGSTYVTIGTEGGGVTCATNYNGTLEGPSSVLDLSMFIEYFNCEAWGFVNMTVNNEGCSELFQVTEKEGAGQYGGEFGMNCPAGQGLILSINAPYIASCQIKIEGQEGLSRMDFDNVAGPPNRVATKFEVTDLAYTVTKDQYLFCPLEGTGAKTNGTITSESFSLRAVNPSKTTEEVGLKVSGE